MMLTTRYGGYDSNWPTFADNAKQVRDTKYTRPSQTISFLILVAL